MSDAQHNNSLTFKETLDGSFTLFNPSLNETYHSINGAYSESLHVYIENGLKLKNQASINVLEIGFGTGMNALLTAEHLENTSAINYLSLEPFPVEINLLKSYYQQFKQHTFNTDLLERMLASDGKWLKLNENMNICISSSTLQNLKAVDFNNNRKADLIYYDAFAPSKQADMWSLETLSIAIAHLEKGGVLCTYCAQGQFKRNLMELGMQVSNPRGPNGKREMTVAYKPH
ncbi:MAG TPA: tRNA (5-methylaminomethyl-2-thiouridine)(34)-methyltransferase MnmD [Bacteroidia bacterium]